MASPISGVASAKLKLARIGTQIDVINSIISELANSQDAYEIAKDSNGKEIINFLVDAPAAVQIIAGEIIYQFRSALDHLAFDLVRSNPQKISLPARWEERCQFPLHLDVPTHGKTVRTPYPVPVPYEAFEYRLPGLTKSAYTFIESVQPYHRGPGVHNILRIIGTLANIDKHRHLYVLLHRASVSFNFTYTDGMLAASSFGGLKHGAEVPWLAEIPEGTPPKDMKRSFTPYITFDETIGEGPDTLGAENLLEVCLEQFKTVIVPEFEKLIQSAI